ncbi:MAG TPA: SpoVR family protein [Planctomycetaceae bacterium]|nr:SpoVR family protein [Planctomycetaceae bacterium]
MSTVTTHRPLPAEIAAAQEEMEGHARDYGLDFFETIFEVLDYDEINMVAAYGGFPVRYAHWRYGAQYEELTKSYSYGLSKIYEMVINTDPCYAYLLACNPMLDQKLVIAHVYGHCDFFKNNAWFAHTNRRMLDQMANHAARVSRYIDRFGYDAVEEFIDACLSIEDLIDVYSPHIRRKDPIERPVASALASEADRKHDPQVSPTKFRSKDYMDSYINPPDVLRAEVEALEKEEQEKEKRRSFPDEPQRDVLLFLLDHAPLKEWQHDVLSIVRDEAYYFAPQGQTKIMNEGWASFWHSKIMTRHGLTDAEVVDYADHHSGTMATSRNRLNPYKLGIELLKDIEERWNRGQFGPEYDQCTDALARSKWDKQLGLGRQKIFEVRRVHNDVTFIDTFLTPEFCVKQNFFEYKFNESTNYYEIASREFQAIKTQLLNALTNHGRPFIFVLDGNYRNRGELYLLHQYEGIELKQDYAQDTLANIQKLWRRPVHIETVIDEKPAIMSFDGSNHEVHEK